MNAVIRDSRPKDMAAVTGIYEHYVTRTTSSFEEAAPGEAEMRSRRDEVLARGLPYLVAEMEGRIVGFAYAGSFRQRSAYRFTVEDSIYVASGRERLGIGGALLERLVTRCAAAGFQQMVAVIGDSANASSIGVHASRGFQVEGILHGVGLKFGRWLDVVIMRRSLEN
ncbi:MAG: N-acetyltransferase [Alphaproteobacteria bacterium]|nr:N-acetyltransferase [Alphaproteobacteria bacterium]